MQICKEDLELIAQQGAPVEPGRALVIFGAGDAVELTDRGKAFYRAALAAHGLAPGRASSVRTRSDLRDITLAIKEVRVHQGNASLSQALDQDNLPVQSRESVRAYLGAQWEKLKLAVVRRELCAAAGSNVIPADFSDRPGRNETA